MAFDLAEEATAVLAQAILRDPEEIDAPTRRGDPPRVRWFDFLDSPWARFIGKK